MEKFLQNYFLGLDIGTTSCGFAVTDENYNVVRAKGKKLWGVRLFEEAETASSRRLKRSSRRRLERRKLKLAWLNEIFAKEIAKVDKDFYDRIKYSPLFVEDKKAQNKDLGKYSLFDCEIDGKKYTDRDFYKDYKSIYHLRKELLSTPAKDIRFLYLAIHSIIKRRGHFLYEGDFADNASVLESVNDLVTYVNTLPLDASISLEELSEQNEKKLLKIVADGFKKKDAKNFLYGALQATTKQAKALTDSLVNGIFEGKKIFGKEVEKLDFSAEDIQDKMLALENVEEDELILIEKAKNLYSLFQMKKVLGNCNYVCESMVETITTHERQLKEFKSFIKKYYSTKYHEIFRAENTKVVNYAHYINQTKYNGGKKVLGLELPSTEKRTKDNFYKYIKGILNTKIENETQEYLALRNEFLELIENDNFLPKPRSKNNSVLPNKLYEKELMQILKVNEQKYEFLKEIDAEFGITTSQKICQILTFRVPYFVGPITDKTNKNAWAIKLSNQALKPWNIEQIIDYSQAEEEFIKRMVKKCTYMPKYNAMPKKSLLYSEFCVLNELNNLTINGNLITIKEKQFIYDYGFKKHKKVTLSILRQLLISNGFYTETDLAKDSFGGIDKGFANSLSTYVSLCEKFGQEFVNEHKQYFEKVIFYSTISSDKDRFVKKLKKEFTIFTDDQIKFLKSITCTDWGRISKEFLTTTFIDKSTGELTSVIQELYNKNYNLQQIINSQNYTLEERLQQDTTADLETLTYEAVEELYCSPAVKRGVWQAVKIIKEIVATMGKMPSKIFVEVTRSDEQKGDAGRKKSRKDTLTEIYAECLKDSSKELTKELNQLIDQLNNKNDANLRSEMLYLYFLQQGKCMYTGEPIAIADLFNNNVYDVDHIVPQSVLKDDSIDNKVLVKKQTNLEKSDRYPLPSNWIAKQKDFWAMLNKYKFISDKKYQKLIRRTELSSQELGDFIARQLVETNQSCKAVIEFLKAVVDNPRDVVYSKAGRVSDFRHKYDILKCRDVNDYHHAKDAYLNVVVGNVLFNRFTNNPRHFYADKSKNKNAGLTKHVLKLFDTTVKEFFGDKVVWDKQVHLPIVKETCLKNDCLISYMSYCNYNTAFYKETIHKSLLHNKKSEAKISLKGEDNALSNFEKYGGFTDYNSAYFMVVKSDKRGKIITTIETVTAYLYKKYNGDSNKILQHIAKEQGLVNAQIVLDRINIKSTIKIGKGEYLLAGKSSDVYILHNFNEWKTSKEINDYVRIIAKYNDFVKNKKDKLLTILDDQIIVSDKSERGTTQLILSKEKNLWLYNCIIQQLQKEMYDFSSFLIILEYLTKNKELFYGLEIKAQVSLLTSLIKKLSIGASTVNLSQINGKPTVGIITLGKNITGKNIKLILRSVTGLYEKTINLGD